MSVTPRQTHPTPFSEAGDTTNELSIFPMNGHEIESPEISGGSFNWILMAIRLVELIKIEVLQ
jgi:hypothetical protein